MEHALPIYQQGADVIFPAAGDAGYGVVLAAQQVTAETGLHRSVIGMDYDVYAALDPGDPSLPYTLTSMLKRTDTALYAALENYANDTFTPGIRWFDLANDGIDYARSGGYIEEIVPELERLRAAVVSGESEVPLWPEGVTPPEQG